MVDPTAFGFLGVKKLEKTWYTTDDKNKFDNVLPANWFLAQKSQLSQKNDMKTKENILAARNEKKRVKLRYSRVRNRIARQWTSDQDLP